MNIRRGLSAPAQASAERRAEALELALLHAHEQRPVEARLDGSHDVRARVARTAVLDVFDLARQHGAVAHGARHLLLLLAAPLLLLLLGLLDHGELELERLRLGLDLGSLVRFHLQQAAFDALLLHLHTIGRARRLLLLGLLLKLRVPPGVGVGSPHAVVLLFLLAGRVDRARVALVRLHRLLPLLPQQPVLLRPPKLLLVEDVLPLRVEPQLVRIGLQPYLGLELGSGLGVGLQAHLLGVRVKVQVRVQARLLAVVTVPADLLYEHLVVHLVRDDLLLVLDLGLLHALLVQAQRLAW
eukprot:scaffold115434_cov60-Phaeocystis_antarctica.AAC.1